MASKWKLGTREGYFTVSDGCFSFMLREKRQWAEELVELLNEHESLRVENAAMKEERRWRKIGEEWPEHEQLCQLATGDEVYVRNYFFLSDRKEWWFVNHRIGTDGHDYNGPPKYPIHLTHWRPVPMDVPKEEG